VKKPKNPKFQWVNLCIVTLYCYILYLSQYAWN
jgi:hypothetical protein